MPKSRGRKPSIKRDRTRAVDEDALPVPTGDRRMDVAAPTELTDDAAELWDATVPSLVKMGAYTPGDVPLLIEFCSALALARAARQEYEAGVAHGTALHVDRNGGEHDVPFIGSSEAQRMRTAWKSFIDMADKLGAQFGLTPTARARLGLTVIRATSLRDALEDALGDPEDALT